MAKMTRRRLIKQTAIGVGAAGTLAAAAVAGVKFAPAASPKQVAATSTDPIVVWIGNPANGTIVMMRGEQQIVVHNPAFVQSVLSL